VKHPVIHLLQYIGKMLILTAVLAFMGNTSGSVVIWLGIAAVLLLVGTLSQPVRGRLISAHKVRRHGVSKDAAILEQALRVNECAISDEASLTHTRVVNKGVDSDGQPRTQTRKTYTRIVGIRHVPTGLEVDMQPPGHGISVDTILTHADDLDYCIDRLAGCDVETTVTKARGALATVHIRMNDPLDVDALSITEDALPEGWL